MQEKVFSHAEELFEEGDTNHDGKLSSEELQDLLMRVGLHPLSLQDHPACLSAPLSQMSGAWAARSGLVLCTENCLLAFKPV